MKINDIAIQAEALEDVRGGSYQEIFNGATIGASLAFGGDVNSTTTSKSDVFAAHTNAQTLDVSSIRSRITEIGVFGSKGVRVNSSSPWEKYYR